MALEATILERYQELLKWQVEQEERLLKQQQEQRDLLNFEQARKFEALGLSSQNIALHDSLVGEENCLSMDDRNVGNESQRSVMSEPSPRKDCPEPNGSEVPSVFQKTIGTESLESASKLQLKVPSLQLTTNRYLNFQSSIEGFSPQKEIPADREIVNERRLEEVYGEDENFGMEGVAPLSVEKPPKTFIQLDDLPVPSPKKDFETLLEERLREETEDEGNSEKNPKPRIKRPFLKKGEGLARFKPNPNGNSSRKLERKRSTSLSANTRSTPTLSVKNNPAKLKETPKSSRASSSYGKGIPATAQAKLNLKNVSLPKAKVRSKLVGNEPKPKPCAVNKARSKVPIDLNVSSDMETKTRRELEEMRIFELLEEKAENSSFCSNSSAVLALLRQSTPVKSRNASVENSPEKKQRGKLEVLTKKHETSDSNFEEIVRSTKSNKMMPSSPVTKIRETVIQKDFVISQWDSEKENIDSSNSNRVSNRAIAAGTYKSTKHTTIQFNNNNNNINNNNDNYKALIDSNSSDHSNRDKNVIRHDFTNKRTAENLEPEKESANVSLHVRFSEYNEYKTIDLTDTSIMSNDVNNSRVFKEDEAWSDRSTSPDSSDVEVLFSKIGHNKLPKTSNYLSTGMTNGENIQNSCDDETTDQTTDNEDEDYNTSICSNGESYDEENTTVTESKEEENRFSSDVKNQESSDHESENCNDSGSTIGQENDELRGNEIDSIAGNDTIFKSELLKTRLAELEREIEIFRKENAALVVQRKKLQDEARQLQKEYKIKEESLEKERKANEDILQEEKRRLAREKTALESRLRDAREKSLLSKQERQETQILREQLEELREEINQKDSRWQAAQARQKSQIRVLQTENSRLKQELEKLKASKTNNSRNRKPLVSSNTRSIHLINKHLDSKKNIISRQDSSSDEEKTAQIIYGKTKADDRSVEDEDLIVELEIEKSKSDACNGIASRQASIKDDEDLRKKRNLYTNLLSEATEGLRGNEQIILGKHDKSRQQLQEEINKEEEKRSEITSGDCIDQKKWENSTKINYNGNDRTIETSHSPNSKNSENSLENYQPRSPNEQKNICSTEARRWSDVPICQNDRVKNSTIKQQDIREVQCPDGHLEYWYPNGNVKKIYPDRNVIKMIYYNGDVRESLPDGSVKYFYASTRTWHTTLPDGLEILEFPDGQVEKRSKDGTNEVSFPDGAVRLLQADGTEKWVLPDGTVAETFPDGNKILSLPNGQREVHTAEHKRREYPDGTVKLVYPDGTQETRYSTGRVRVKDKDGKLLMDVHHR